MQREPIAIVNMASVLPGALSADAYWKNIQAGVGSIRDVPAGRWEVVPQDIVASAPTPDRTYSTRGGFVEGFQLDASGIKLDAGLLADLDPLFQWVLHVGHAATQGVRVPKERTGVALANLALPTDAFARLGRTGWRRVVRLALGSHASALEDAEPTPHLLNHFQQALPAGLLAQALDLQGGTLALDAACASSLYAVKLACDQLQEGRVDAMLAGGVARTDHLCLAVGFSQLKAISRAGQSRPFDAQADGLVPGEGCGLFYLRRLSDALAAREPVVAVIKGIGLSNDGKGRGVLVPMSQGQIRSMKAAYAEAGVDPQSVGLVECHATGTPLGDAAEINSLRNVWGQGAPNSTAVGSAKSNLGHLLTAAGSAGLIKGASAVRDAVLPPTLNYTAPSSGTDLAGTPLFINTRNQPWNQAQGPRRAAVSAFGFGGCNAHLILEEAPRDRPAFTVAPRPARERPQPLAVVAMHARWGQALNVDAYREALFEGRSLLTAAPPGRWFGLEENADAMRPLPGAYITGLTVPDPMRLRIPPAEIERMLPQQLLALLVAEEMLADGAVLGRISDKARVGVCMAMSMEADAGDYAFRWAMQRDAQHADPQRAAWLDEVTQKTTRKITAEPVLGFLANLLANRISARFDLGGPSWSLSAEDAGALKALEAAALMLRRNDVDAMVVGGVDLPGDVRTLWATDAVQGWTYSEPRPWDRRADGSAPGEGAGVLVLKRLADAQRDGDNILAVLRGVGSSSDGAAGRPGSPSERGYEQALRRALEDADVAPRGVGLVVAHGSGRPSEDGPEGAALHRVFGGGHREPHAALVTTKPVAGHAGAASGMQSLMAAVLALRHRSLPPTRGVDEPAHLDLWKGSPFYASRKARPWMVDSDEGPRRACVGAMSLDGNHVHLVLEEGPDPVVRSALGPATEILFLFRAASREQLAQQVEAFASQARGSDLDRLAKARAAQHVRSAPGMVLAIVTNDHDDLEKKAAKAAAALRAGVPALMDIHGVFFTQNPLHPRGKMAFVFPGAGNAYPGMAREIVLRYPELVEDFSRKTVAARNRSMEYWVNPREIVKRRIPRDEMRTPIEMIWAAGYYTQMLGDVLRKKLGIRPDAAVGYSLGESSGLFALGAWSAVDELYHRMTTWPLLNSEIVGPMNAILRAWEAQGVDVAQYRGRVFWGTYMVVANTTQVAAALVNEPLVHMAIINAPNEVVISGEIESCKRVIAALNTTFHPTPFPAAVHVPEVVVVEDEYRRLHTLPTNAPPGITYYSSGAGVPYEVTVENVTQSIIDQAINCVDFPRVVNRAWEDGVRIFVEVGPRGSCTRWIEKILAGKEHHAVASDRKGRSEFVNILHVAAQLAAQGVDVDLGGLYSTSADVPRVHTPAHARTYPTAWALNVAPPQETLRAAPARPALVPAPMGQAAVNLVPPAATPIRVPRSALPPAAPPPPRAAISRTVLPPMGIQRPGTVVPRAAAPSSLPPLTTLHTDGALGSTMDALAAPVAFVTDHAQPGGPMTAVPLWANPLQEAPLAPPPGEDVPELMALFHSTFTHMAEAHRTFLESTTQANAAMARLMRLAAPESYGAQVPAPVSMVGTPASSSQVVLNANGLVDPITPVPPPVVLAEKPVFTAEQIVAHGVGTPSQLWGPDYAVFDQGRRMARLPNGPYLCLDRITQVGQPPRELKNGAWLVGEYDVPHAAWYFEANTHPVMPFSVMLEAFLQPCGFLASYMGSDLRCAQDRRFRNLGGKVTTHRLVTPGSGTLRTLARLKKFSEYGDMLVVDYDVEMTQDGHKVMEGSSYFGFFTDEALAAQKGLSGKLPPFLDTALPNPVLARDVPGVPQAPLRMFDRVVALDERGGRHGKGYIRTEKDVNPQEWFFRAHFHQDPVTPGSLGVDGLLQTMQAYMLNTFPSMQGLQFEPVMLGHTWEWTYRGQVVGRNKRVTMEVEVLERHEGPEPVLVADAFLSVDGIGVYRLDNVALRARRR